MATKPKISDTAQFDILVYNDYKDDSIQIYIPKVEVDFPKKGDYDKGYCYRYFFQQANDKKAKVREITKSEYNKIQNNFLYRTLKIKWKIIGDAQIAKGINAKVVSVADKVLPGITNILSNNLLLYWRDLPDTPIQFDVSNKLPKVQIKKKVFNVDLVTLVSFDERGFVYILTEDSDVIYTEDSIGILAQL